VCPYCGELVMYVPTPRPSDKRIKVDARLTGFRPLGPGETMGDVFFDEHGAMRKGLATEELVPDRGHRPHYLRCRRSSLTGR